jgi:hypothetical protein
LHLVATYPEDLNILPERSKGAGQIRTVEIT